MSDQLEYNDEIIMSTLKDEVCEQTSVETWNALIKDIGVPDIENEPKCECATMRTLMDRFDDLIDKETGKKILTNVRHGLKHSQFIDEKKEFDEYKNIDEFNKISYEDAVETFTEIYQNKGDFYGQPITKEALDFIVNQPGMLATIRKGNELHITAFPADIVAYLNETDERKKRYLACHCPFARESILSEDGMVSKTICNCSLGHCKVRWEAIFDRELDGDVLQSVLGGDLLCKYVIYLPKDIMDKYVKE